MNDKVDLFVDFYLYFTTLLTAELFGLMVFRICHVVLHSGILHSRVCHILRRPSASRMTAVILSIRLCQMLDAQNECDVSVTMERIDKT